MAPINRPANVEPVAQNEEEVDEEYLNKRARNNDAVKRSRQKAREKANETNSRVQKLKNENEKLEEKIKLLSKELTFLKDIFLAHAGTSHGINFEDMDVAALLKEDTDDDAFSEHKMTTTTSGNINTDSSTS